MANLLEKASIILTPTAYDDGKVLAIKPSEAPYGDFDFTRNSSATRVNAQGLVEDVQILSSNLVQNGDFSQIGSEEVTNGNFSQEGSELILNGDFATDSDWTITNNVGSSTNISGGSLNIITDGTYTQAAQDNSLVSGKSYVLTYTITSNAVVGSLSIVRGSSSLVVPSTVGTHSFYFESDGAGFAFKRGGGALNISIDNVSVKEVGQNWTLTVPEITIGDSEVNFNSVANASSIRQDGNLTVGKIYKATYTVSNYSQGGAKIRIGGIQGTNRAANGTYTEYIKAELDTNVRVYAVSTTTLSITNISVKEVGQNWNLDSANASIGENKIIANSSITENIANQNGILPTQKSVILKYDVIVNSGAFRILLGSGGTTTQITTSGTYTFTETTGTGGTLTLQARGGGFDGSITNISVIEITDDTNLPRINYSGFTYQDSLGSELITSGNDTSNIVGLADNQNINIQTSFLTIGKTYKIDFEIYDYVEGSIFLLRPNDLGVGTSVSANGTYTYTVVADASTSLIFRTNGLSTTLKLRDVSVKEYLGQEVVPDSGCGAWLFEPQSTNLITYSEDFSQWFSSGDVTVESGYLAPDGTNNAYKISGTTSALTLGGASETSTRTIYARTISGTGQANLCSFNQNTNNLFTITDQWQRFEVNGAIATGGTTFYAVDFRGNTTLTEILLWGAQSEALSYATSYIPTEGTIKTRNQDLCTNGGDVSLINSSEGVLYAQISALANDGTSRSICLSNGFSSQRVLFRYDTASNRLQFFIVSTSVIQASLTFDVSNALDVLKFAIKYKENDFALWVNGIEVDTVNSGVTPIGLNTLQFANGSGGQPFFGNTKALGVWKEALTDAELRSLTYPTPTAPTFDLDFNTIATDFTFTRNSEATFVNAQGLIQSTNEIGAEEITNGDFSTDGIPSTTSWSLGWYSQTSNVLISGGKLTLTNSASESSSLAYATDGVSSLSVVTVNKTYKLQYRVIENNGVTSFKYYSAGGSFIVAPTDLGVTHTIYIKNFTNQIFLFKNATTNSSISIDNVSVKEVITETNTPRLDYSTGAEAFLLEPQRTNLIKYSEDFSGANWVVFSDITVTPNTTDVLSPSGFYNANKVVSTNATRGFYYTGLSVTSDVTRTIYLKGSVGGETVLLKDGSGNGGSSAHTLTTDWVRYELKTTNDGNTYQGLFVDDISVGTIYAWGAQFEEGSYATSYIPTSGTTVTRNQELCNNATPVINSEEGVLYAEISALVEVDAQRRFITLNDGTSSNGVVLRYEATGVINARYQIVGSAQASFNYTTTITDTHKVAFKWKENNFALWVDGVEVGTDNNGNVLGANIINNIDFNSGNGTFPFFGNTKGLKVYPKALSDVELQDLTTI